MKRIDFTHLGKMPFSQDRADYMQQSYTEPLAAIARLCGNKTILHGVEVAGGNVSDGWISYNGELIFFVGGVLSTDVVITVATTPFTYGNASVHDVYFTKTATCGPAGDFPFADLVPLLSLQNVWLPGDIKQKVVDATYEAANFDGSGYGINQEKGWRKLSSVYANAAGAVMVNKKDGDTEFGVVENFGGEKAHQLATGELPKFRVKLFASDVRGGPQGTEIVTPDKKVARGGTNKGDNNYEASYSDLEATLGLSSETGNDEAHNNLQPYFVVLTLLKI